MSRIPNACGYLVIHFDRTKEEMKGDVCVDNVTSA